MPEKAKPRVRRRTLLIGGAAVVVLAGAGALGVEQNILPGRSTMFKLLGLDGAAGTIPDAKPGPMVSGTYASKARLGKDVGWSVSYPPGSKTGDKLPVLISLHGIGGNHGSSFGSGLGLDRFLAKSVEDGGPRFAIAAIDGGRTYWHHRASGEDAGAMVTEEFIPLLADHGLETSKVALLGWSMGGFGALHIASKLGANRVASVVAESPAMWPTVSRVAQGAFDSAADFAANTPVGRQSELDGIPVRVDCGTGDGFYPEAKAYVAGFTTRPAGGFTDGGHNLDYWRRMAGPQLKFVGSHF
jgi:pimeloyl-ACP methyl ester carboxylesterase